MRLETFLTKLIQYINNNYYDINGNFSPTIHHNVIHFYKSKKLALEIAFEINNIQMNENHYVCYTLENYNKEFGEYTPDIEFVSKDTFIPPTKYIIIENGNPLESAKPLNLSIYFEYEDLTINYKSLFKNIDISEGMYGVSGKLENFNTVKVDLNNINYLEFIVPIKNGNIQVKSDFKNLKEIKILFKELANSSMMSVSKIKQ